MLAHSDPICSWGIFCTIMNCIQGIFCNIKYCTQARDIFRKLLFVLRGYFSSRCKAAAIWKSPAAPNWQDTQASLKSTCTSETSSSLQKIRSSIINIYQSHLLSPEPIVIANNVNVVMALFSVLKLANSGPWMGQWLVTSDLLCLHADTDDLKLSKFQTETVITKLLTLITKWA